jgi:thioesterase domain-containing protein
VAFNLKRIFGKNIFTDPELFDIKLDRPVVLNGIRLSLGEIEEILNQQADIKNSYVLAVETDAKQPRLIAYIIPERPVENARQFQQRLRHILPMHLTPEQFVLLDDFPRTPSGEVDIQRLPVPEPEQPIEEAVSGSRGERFLFKLWKEILENDSVGLDDDFFKLGGEAELAARMLSRIESSTGVKLSLEQLRSHPSPRALAGILDQARPASSSETTIELRSGDGGPIFLVPAAARTSLSAMRYVSRIKEGLRVVGVEYPRVLPVLPPAKRVPALAEYFIKQIIAVQPQGPYLLAGNCMGGTLVYEIVQQLMKAGHHVERVILIDCAAPRLQSESHERALNYYVERMAFILQSGTFLKTIKSRFGIWFRPIRRFNMDADIRQAIKYLWDAKAAYRASARFSGNMLVILNSLSRESQRASDWQETAPAAQIHFIEDTDHLELFQSERALKTVGELMNDYLSESNPAADRPILRK